MRDTKVCFSIGDKDSQNTLTILPKNLEEILISTNRKFSKTITAISGPTKEEILRGTIGFANSITGVWASVKIGLWVIARPT